MSAATLPLVIDALGGLGLFLLGMILMTGGLREVAGDAVRAHLMRFTRTPLSGALTGATTTTLLQSSSATTVAAVGFVGAELMSFDNALGIIFGANIGSTVTGWLVAFVGFKLDLGALALPLVFVGAVLRLFARGRLAQGGLALAGFGLIFVGIAQLQDGMRGLEGSISFAGLPAEAVVARLQLVALGIAFTLVTQASSAVVAAALTALNAGLLGFEQAACIVIGADVGTTVTALMATVGASLEARRTGLSHVIYNLATGVLAFALVDVYAGLVDHLWPGLRVNDVEFMLVGFHTGFNVLGVILVLPFARPFARLVKRLVRPRDGERVAGLDEALLEQPQLALAAAHKAVEQVFVALLAEVNRVLDERADEAPADLAALQRRLDDLQDFVGAIDLRGTRGGEWERLLALVHALDHLQRLHERLEEEPLRAAIARAVDELDPERQAFVAAAHAIIDRLGTGRPDLAAARAAAVNEQLRVLVQPFRAATAAAMARRELSVEGGTERLEAVRWLRRVGRHVARVSHHLAAAAQAAAK